MQELLSTVICIVLDTFNVLIWNYEDIKKFGDSFRANKKTDKVTTNVLSKGKPRMFFGFTQNCLKYLKVN